MTDQHDTRSRMSRAFKKERVNSLTYRTVSNNIVTIQLSVGDAGVLWPTEASVTAQRKPAAYIVVRAGWPASQSSVTYV